MMGLDELPLELWELMELPLETLDVDGDDALGAMRFGVLAFSGLLKLALALLLVGFGEGMEFAVRSQLSEGV